MSIKAESGRKSLSGEYGERKRESVVLATGLLLVLLILSRYIVNGEPVDVRSDEAQTTVALPVYDGMEIRQPLTVTEEMDWRQGYYALRFAECDNGSGGRIVCTLEQGEVLGTDTASLSEMEAGEWIRLDNLDFGKLECGEAVLHLNTEGVEEGELAVFAGTDYYGFGIVDYNGARQGLTLAQAYHYHITGTEYRVRLLCYGFVVLCVVLLLLLMRGGRIGDRGRCLAVFGVMTVMFMAVIYLLDSSVYLEPTYAEAVTNFLKFAREESFADNLLITDAGYLPLLPRLITLFYVKILRLPSAYALYFMQATACLLCSMVWSFFVLYPFHGLMRLHNRILWCILVMLTCFYEETVFFTNHGYWGIYLLLLLLAADLECFSRWGYAVLAAASAVICLSKGTYAVMLPLMILYLVFFYRSIGRRNKIFAYVTGAASLLQLLYAFGGQGDGGSWVGTASMGQIGYWFRLAGRIFAEFGAYLLSPFGASVQRIPVLVLAVALAAAVFLAVDFTVTVLLPVIRKERIDRAWVAFYTAVLFQLIVSAFFLVTVKTVPDSWNDIGKIAFRQMGHKYEIFSNIGFYMLLLTGSALFMHTDARHANGYCVLALLLVFCMTHPVVRLAGWKDAEISDGRVYAGDISAGWWDHKDMISDSAFFIPVRDGNWGYSRNVTVYQAGADSYFEETSCINLEEKVPDGYHSTYEVPDGMPEAQNLIEVMIERPVQVGRPVCRIQLLDGEGTILAEARQVGSGRNKKCIFRLAEPVGGVKTIRFMDEDGGPVYFKDYIALVHAW